MPAAHLRRTSAVVAAVLIGILGAVLPGATPSKGSVPAGLTALPVSHVGPWLVDGQRRAVILHGLNQVYKIAPYTPSSGGFGEDDATFLQQNGFNAMRIGVIWAAVEPAPGVYDDAYLNSVAQTVDMLGAHGIVSLLDFHQDLYNEKFQGEGAPAWAVHDIGLPNPPLGFPWNYFGNPAENHAWDAFWVNAKASDGIGYQDHYAAAWRHVAQRFGADPNVYGYDLMNEPWPGTLYAQCLAPLVGCPLFDTTLTKFYRKVVTAIRSVDSTTITWVAPNVLNAEIDATAVGKIDDANVGWSFHDYCGPQEIGLGSDLCPTLDLLTMGYNVKFAQSRSWPAMLTEFGATRDTANLTEVVQLADKLQIGWLEWAYTGGDITSQDSSGQALVLDPSQPPTGANVVESTLKSIAEPYPQVVAGTPTAWSFKNGVFTLTYSTKKIGSLLSHFAAGSETDISVPAVQFPSGYAVSVTGATVVSAPNATLLRVLSKSGASTITVTVAPA
ncbi:MAG TPA: cellulase family glycosylhydrolase [Jatrophihabitantaceae bacterium]|nr:cellulase family glycosylhydrolase [Jatrophihabitantaceae bacterium]